MVRSLRTGELAQFYRGNDRSAYRHCCFFLAFLYKQNQVALSFSVIFAARYAYKRSLCRRTVSVRLSIRHVRGLCIETNKHNFNFFNQQGSHVILGFPHQTSWQYSDGDTPPPLTGMTNAGG